MAVTSETIKRYNLPTQKVGTQSILIAKSRTKRQLRVKKRMRTGNKSDDCRSESTDVFSHSYKIRWILTLINNLHFSANSCLILPHFKLLNGVIIKPASSTIT